MAVSYTHLDVYKRQGLLVVCRHGADTALLIKLAGTRWNHAGKFKPRHSSESEIQLHKVLPSELLLKSAQVWHYWILISCYMCPWSVSYTHLDVYKRQQCLSILSPMEWLRCSIGHKQYLLKIVDKNQTDWNQRIPLFLMAYRSSVHDTTGMPPAKLVFGREIRLPGDLMFG